MLTEMELSLLCLRTVCSGFHAARTTVQLQLQHMEWPLYVMVCKKNLWISEEDQLKLVFSTAKL